MPRQSLVHLLDVEQRSGQFAVPLASGSDPFIDAWLARAPEKASRVAELGLYYLEGVARKFGMYWTSLKSSLIAYGIIRMEDNGTSWHPVNSLSIAQAFSWRHRVPIEDILLSAERNRSAEFRSLPAHQRVALLHDAYTGSFWYSNFLTRQRRAIDSAAPPPVPVDYPVHRAQLYHWFPALGDPQNALRKLERAGFLTFSSGSRLTRAVPPGDLSALVEVVYGQAPEFSSHEKAFEDFARFLARGALRKVMAEYGLQPDQHYSIPKLSSLTDKDYNTLKQAEYRGLLRVENGTVLGRDAAVYLAKSGLPLRMTVGELHEFFGAFCYASLGWQTSKDSTYSVRRYVRPTIDRVARQAQEYLANLRMRPLALV